MAETPPEEGIGWLTRSEISLRARADYLIFRDELETKLFEPTEKQINFLWKVSRIDTELRDLGARAVEYHFPWYTETRWIIKGYRGAWGWERMIEITRWTE